MGNQSQINTYFLYSSVVKDRLTFEGTFVRKYLPPFQKGRGIGINSRKHRLQLSTRVLSTYIGLRKEFLLNSVLRQMEVSFNNLFVVRRAFVVIRIKRCVFVVSWCASPRARPRACPLRVALRWSRSRPRRATT